MWVLVALRRGGLGVRTPRRMLNVKLIKNPIFYFFDYIFIFCKLSVIISITTVGSIFTDFGSHNKLVLL